MRIGNLSIVGPVLWPAHPAPSAGTGRIVVRRIVVGDTRRGPRVTAGAGRDPVVGGDAAGRIGSTARAGAHGFVGVRGGVTGGTVPLGLRGQSGAIAVHEIRTLVR